MSIPSNGSNETGPAIRTVSMVSLGCPKNLIDSEKMFGLLGEAGLIPVSDEAEADAIVINTCGFLEAAKLESVDEINRVAEFKKFGSCKRLVVAGCLVQRHRARLLKSCPDIDALIGVFDRDRVVEAVQGRRPAQDDLEVDRPVYSSIAANALLARRQRGLDPQAGYFESDEARLRLTPRHYAYLRISEGCNQNCTFCTIPSIRGKMRSKPLDALVRELGELLSDGAFEINLIGQDTTSYGRDIGYGPGLVGMLETIDQAVRTHSGAGWLRLMYAYPSCFTDEMIDAIAGLPHVLKYIDMPLQHINDRVLETMRRHTGRRLIETLLGKLRDRSIAVRTTLISGFPGETEAEHRELVDFVGQFGFEAMGVFAYSPEPGTPAGTMHAGGQAIDPQVIAERIDELMSTQQQVVFDRHGALARQSAEFEVLIDAEVDAADGQGLGATGAKCIHRGRIYKQAPQIDGVTYVLSKNRLVPGDLVPSRVVDAAGYDLVARPAGELSRVESLPIFP